MATGNDARAGFSKETTYGTRVTPARFFPFISEGIGYAYDRVFPPVLGGGLWNRPSRVTTQSGSGPVVMPVTTTGFGYLLDLLHNNVVTPVQQGATAAYLQTHTLTTAPAKSLSGQFQMPPLSSATLLPWDFTGMVFGSVEFSWDTGQELRTSFTVIVQKSDTAQALATYVAPTSWSFFTFLDGSISIGGTPVAEVTGGGSVTIDLPMRTDAFYFGGAGTIGKPVLIDKPSVSAAITVDFEDLTHWNRVVNDTTADVVLRFNHPTAIAGTYFPFFQITAPDCKFSSPRPVIDGPGPLSQSVTAQTASGANNAPTILYQSPDVSL